MATICDYKNGKITDTREILPIEINTINDDRGRVEIEFIESALERIKGEIKATTGASLQKKQIVETPAIDELIEVVNKGETPSPELVFTATQEKFGLTGDMNEILEQEKLRKAPNYIKNEETGEIEINPNKLGVFVEQEKNPLIQQENELLQLKDELEISKEVLRDHPGKQFIKYTNKKLGELPEVTGNGDSIWAKQGDDIATELGFESEVEARQALEDYIEYSKQVKQLEQQYKEKKETFNQAKTKAKEFNLIVEAKASGITFEEWSKNEQLKMVQKLNPMTDDIHTGIRSVEDIKTYEEAFNDPESFVYPDYSKKDAEKAIEEKTITIYSSKPLNKNEGQFVSPSKMQAQDYAGDGEIYKKTVSLDEVAWINGDEGQLVGATISKSQWENINIDTKSMEGGKQVVIDSTREGKKKESTASIIQLGKAQRKIMKYNSSKQQEFKKQFNQVKEILGDDIPAIFETAEQLIGQGTKEFPLIKFRDGRASTVDGPKTRFAMKDLILTKFNAMTDDQIAQAKVLMRKIDQFEVNDEAGTTAMSSAIGSLGAFKDKSLTNIKEEIEDHLSRTSKKGDVTIDYEEKYNRLKEKLNSPDELKKALAKLEEDIRKGKITNLTEDRGTIEREAIARHKKSILIEEIDKSETLTPKEKEFLKEQISLLNSLEDIENEVTLKNFIKSMDKETLTDEELKRLTAEYNKVTGLFDKEGNIKDINLGEVKNSEDILNYYKTEQEYYRVYDELKNKNGVGWSSTLWGQYKLGALQGVKTPIAGIVLDLVETITGPVKRRAIIGAGKDIRPDIIPSNLDLVKRDVEIKMKTGMDVIRHQFLDGRTKVYGEIEARLIPKELRSSKTGKLVQSGINLLNDLFLQKGLGVPDQAKASYAFYDTAGLLVTKKLDEMKVKRGTPEWESQYLTYWNDVNRINPLTDEGLEIRNESLLFAFDSTNNPTPSRLPTSKYLPQEAIPFVKVIKKADGEAKGGTLPQLFFEARNMLDTAGKNTLNFLSGGRLNSPFPIGTMLMKYTGVPARIAQKYALDASGASLLYKSISAKFGGEKLTRGDLVTPAMAWALGGALATTVDVNDYYGFWNSGGSSEKKDQMDLENARPTMVKIGGNWVSTEVLGPAYVPFHIAMTIKSSKIQSPPETITDWMEWINKITRSAGVGATVTTESFFEMLPVNPSKEMGDFSNGVSSFVGMMYESGTKTIKTKDLLGLLAGITGSMTRSFTPAGIRDFVLANTDINLDAEDDPTKLALREFLGDYADDVIDLTRWTVGGGELDLTNVDARGIYKGEGENVLDGMFRQVFFGHRLLEAESSPLVEEIIKLNEEGYIFAPKNYVLSQKTFQIPEDKVADEAKEYGKILSEEMTNFVTSSEYIDELGNYVEADPKERAKSLMDVQSYVKKIWRAEASDRYKTLKEIEAEEEDTQNE